jgi:Tol biopolymer transport system component
MNNACRRLLSVFALASLLMGFAIPAFGTFPGRNGRIAFIAGPDLYTMNPDGTNVKQLTNLGPDAQAFWESWSPDGKSIVLNEYRAPDFHGELWLINADGSNQHLLFADTDFTDERPSFTSDGSSIVFSRCRLDVEACGIYQIALTDGQPVKVTSISLGIQDLSPQHSVNGDLAFASVARKGIICAIYLNEEGDTEPRELTPVSLSARQPDWSPDGGLIAFSSHCANPQNEEIWVQDIRAKHARQLTSNGTSYFDGSHDFHPSWSPDGQAIVFERDSADFSSASIYVIRHDGTGGRKLFTLPIQTRSGLLHQRATRIRRGGASPRYDSTELETGGALPQWGVAPQE